MYLFIYKKRNLIKYVELCLLLTVIFVNESLGDLLLLL